MRKMRLFIIHTLLIFFVFFLVGCGEETKTFIVSFDTNGGNNIEDVIVESGSKVDAPTSPMKEDFTFAGWFMDEKFETFYSFNNTVTSDIKLYAKWLKKISIYTVNDFHGAIEDRARQIAGFIMGNKDKNFNNTVVVSAGDMLQGTGISNLKYGLDTINIMNIIGFDAMTCGNHEFDWDLNTVLNYFDNNKDNGEADFPLLGCNIIDKRTGTLPVNMKPYTVVERGGLKIAIIGYMGLGLESSIATKMIENYEFVAPVPIISEIAKQLRTEQNVDIIIACGHDASSVTNEGLANLNGDSRIDAIVNGHTHVKSNGTISRLNDDYSVPYVQADDSGEYVGKIELTYDPDLGKVIYGTATNHKINDSSAINQEVDDYVDKLVEETAPIFNREIGTAGKTLNQGTAAEWACSVMVNYVRETYGECDLAFTNIGGMRTQALPIITDEKITVGRIYQLMPFDNAIKLTTLKGSIVRNLITLGGELKYSTNTVTMDGNTIYINGEILKDDELYRVAAVDYVFDKESYPFLKGQDIISTGKLIRDVMIEAIELSTSKDEKCFLEGDK